VIPLRVNDQASVKLNCTIVIFSQINYELNFKMVKFSIIERDFLKFSRGETITGYTISNTITLLNDNNFYNEHDFNPYNAHLQSYLTRANLFINTCILVKE